ncbi:MAG: rRNA adenine N-6-methyltransferase family protein [Candidatus Pacearchaeota archaeon]
MIRDLSSTNSELVELARTNKYWLEFKSPRDERVLDTMLKVDRKDFLPSFVKFMAYYDSPLPISRKYRATCSMPSLVAAMADLLELKEGQNVLELGTGCGYSAAITAHLIGNSGKLTTLEIIPELAEFGQKNLEAHFNSSCDNGRVKVVNKNGSLGYPENAPYDRIYLTASLNYKYRKKYSVKIIENLLEQVADEGILLFPEESKYSLFLLRKLGKKIQTKRFKGVSFIPFILDEGRD